MGCQGMCFGISHGLLLTFLDWQVYNVYQRLYLPVYNCSMGALW
jgi:hypothetical protein